MSNALEKLKEKVKNAKKKVDIIDFAYELGEKLDELIPQLLEETRKQNELLSEIRNLLKEVNEKLNK